MRILVWLLRAFVFFCLFAFALNNQQLTSVHWFFGHAWTAPLVIIVLVAFGAGTAFGVLAMVPSWWRERRQARRSPAQAANPAQPAPVSTPDPTLPDGI